ncbi:hypothetical protein BJV74DRAFT_796619 [Russula compacta]|nr:hypothetical protein BJV74DRAFT_796619 [Russula compacta]
MYLFTCLTADHLFIVLVLLFEQFRRDVTLSQTGIDCCVIQSLSQMTITLAATRLATPPPHQPVIIPMDDAINLTHLDEDKTPMGHIDPFNETDLLPLDHPGEEWEQYSPRLHGVAFLMMIEGVPQEAKYIHYELGWMTDNPTILGTMGHDMLVESCPLYAEPHTIYGSAHSHYNLMIFKKALQWDADTNKAISMLANKGVEADIHYY